MSRVVAKGLSLETQVSKVMTPNPEVVSSDLTVLEALVVMHDHRFLSLPVQDASGAVLGVVDVMDCISACGGKEGWRSIFSRTIELDDFSDGASVISAESGLASAKFSIKSKGASTSASAIVKQTNDKTVSKLRPKKPLLSSSADSVLAVCQMLASKRGDASLIVDETGMLQGIISDTDVSW